MSWQVGKWESDFKLWAKTTTIRQYKSVYESFQFAKAREDRFQELNWLTIRNQLV